jgi:hypothetical protein
LLTDTDVTFALTTGGHNIVILGLPERRATLLARPQLKANGLTSTTFSNALLCLRTSSIGCIQQNLRDLFQARAFAWVLSTWC